MLVDLLFYLESTLPRLRDNTSTLASEVELARAFLALHKIRMGERLDVEFDVPPELAKTPVPPMMLLTLIENALKHGLGPLPEADAGRSPDDCCALKAVLLPYSASHTTGK